jgi:hypothetical protein
MGELWAGPGNATGLKLATTTTIAELSHIPFWQAIFLLSG